MQSFDEKVDFAVHVAFTALGLKPSFEDWQVNRWPLIERRMTRNDCLRWLQRHGYPTPTPGLHEGPFSGPRPPPRGQSTPGAG